MNYKVVSLFPVLCFLAGSLFAQENTRLSGTITDARSGLSVSGVEVSLEGVGSVFTDDEGRYRFEGLNAGRHELDVISSSYEKISRYVQVEEGQAIVLDFVLTAVQESPQEVVVTASRAKETLDEVPSSISVLNAAQIDQSQAVNLNLAGILAQVPGMSMTSGQVKNAQSLRGRNVLVLIDGIPQSTPLRNVFHDINSIDPNALERIEIIKGSTAIYGNGSDGGVINYITKRPKKNTSFSGLTRIENTGALNHSDNGIRGSVYQQFSGKSGKFDFLVSGLYRQTGVFYDARGEVMSPFYGLGESSSYNAFGKLGYDIAPDQRIEWMANYYRSVQHTNYKNRDGKYGLRPAVGVLGRDKGDPQGTPYNFNTQLRYMAGGIFNNTTDLEVDLYLQRFRTVFYYSKKLADPHNGSEGGQSQLKSNKKGARFNLNTRFDLSDRFQGNLVYGLDVLNDKTVQDLIDGRGWVPELNMRNIAPYAQLKLNLYKDWVLKGGMRFENIAVKVPDYTTLYQFDNNRNVKGGLSVKGGWLRYNATVFNIGLRYNRYPAFKPFVSFSQSFSVSDVGRVLRDAKESDIVSKIKPEVKAVIANNYEVGFDSRPDKYFRFSVSVFLSASKSGATLNDTDGIYRILRAPERVYGYEFQTDIYPMESVDVGGAITYIQGMLDKDDDGRHESYINSLRIPPLKITTYVRYHYKDLFQVRLSGAFHGSRKLFSPDRDGRYKTDEGPVSPVTLIDLFASYKVSRHAKIHLGVENIFNADYYTQMSMRMGRDDRYVKGSGARYNLGLTFDF